MRAAIFNPYLDTLGGGERYAMTVACVLRDFGYQVDIEWKDPSVKKDLELRFGMDLSDINFISDIKKGDGYDLCFWVSDGSIPLLRARKNYLHFQVPFHNIGGKNLINKMKLFRISKVICNSKFTKSFIDKEYGTESIIIYPPVDINRFKSKRKENQILFVGRFSPLLQIKNQDVLIKAFKKFYSIGFNDWKLILAGGVEVGAKEYTEQLEKGIDDYPIMIIKSPSFKDLLELYGKSKIFWSAVGFGEDENKEPEKVEHFGLSLIEAMSAGCIPIVFRAGGYKEIIRHGENGYLWKSLPELNKITENVIRDLKSVGLINSRVKNTVKKYSYEKFRDSFLEVIN